MKEWFGRNLSVGTSGLASEYNPFSPEWLNGTGWARFRGTTPMAGQGYARSFIPPPTLREHCDTVGTSASRCSLRRRPGAARFNSDAKVALRLWSGSRVAFQRCGCLTAPSK
jgi:hypothetical protein